MSEREDGGSAFPLPLGTANCAEPSQSGGMSLRDHFAAQALAGMCAGTPGAHLVHVLAAAHQAYAYADAMLAERCK